jgi:transglutaminase-like putative cysteine protease
VQYDKLGVSKISVLLAGISIILTVFLLLAIGSNSLLQAQYSELYSENLALKQRLQEKETELANLYNRNLALSNELDSAKRYSQELWNAYLNLKSNYDDLLKDYNSLSTNYKILQRDFNLLETRYSELRYEHENLQSKYAELLKKYADILSEYVLFLNQTREVLIYRSFTVYDYKRDRYYMPYVLIPFWTYWNRRADVDRHIPYLNLDYETLRNYYQKALNSWKEDRPIQDLAYELRWIAGNDDELYVNLALQVVHQLYYNVTDYTKYPIESIVEGSGDCDTLSTLLAALLEAGGLDAILILGRVKSTLEERFGGGHAMVGVHLPEPPDDVIRREGPWYITYNGKRYWLMEATWPNPTPGELVKVPWRYDLQGSAVGDFPWAEFRVEFVIDA